MAAAAKRDDDDNGDSTVRKSVEEGMRAYLEYCAIVGEADGGVLMSPEEYEKYRQKVAEARAHRLYVAWRCTVCGLDCHLVGPATRCFCTHTYKTHATDSWRDKRVACRAKGCRCRCFEYVPVHGTFRIRCSCKHFYDEHAGATGPHVCKHPGCTCTKFYSPMSCSCGELWDKHVTAIESREERIAQGRPVDNIGGGGNEYAALGGITSFSSLVDGTERVEPPRAEAAVSSVAVAPSPVQSPHATAEQQRKKQALQQANRLKQQHK